MTRIVLLFRLTSTQHQQHLLDEFEHHGGDGVVASAAAYDGSPALSVETYDQSGSLWEIRATVGMFDDAAVEITEPQSVDDDR